MVSNWVVYGIIKINEVFDRKYRSVLLAFAAGFSKNNQFE